MESCALAYDSIQILKYTMRKLRIICTASAMLFGMTLTSNAQKLGVNTVEEVVNALSTDDKCHLVQGMGTVDTYIGSHEITGATGYTWEISKYGIPTVAVVDGPAGVRLSTVTGSNLKYATFCPSGTALASTWNTSLAEQVAQVIGNETFEYGCAVVLGPGVNIQRHPLCGRNFEYYSEDPLISGKMGAAYVRGIQSQGVGCSVKHFVANNQETNRKKNDARISQRALREIYLKPFEIAIKEGQPWTVMSSYNKLNGTKTAERYDLLTTLLRDEWGYGGIVFSDWINEADAVSELKAGNDLLMPGSTADWWKMRLSASSIKNELKTSCSRILEFIMRTNKFKNLPHSDNPDLGSHAIVARQAAAEACILLKNDRRTLPLNTTKTPTVALFGSISYRLIPGGKGSGYVTSKYTTSLPSAFAAAGFTVEKTLNDAYEAHIKKEGTDNTTGGIIGQVTEAKLPSEIEWTKEQVAAYAQSTEIAIVTIGRSTKEEADRSEEEYFLKDKELTLIENVCEKFHDAGKRVVVVLNIPAPIDMTSWQHLPDAILLPWLGGQEAGNAIVDVLSGAECPSGKLAQTIPFSYKDHASAKNFPVGTSISQDYTNYEEDIYVGYRYFDTFKQSVAYPFGYGLSYTSFEYSNMSVSEDDSDIIIGVTVTNTGGVAGKEVVQIYATAPDCETANKPNRELKAFGKTKTLEPEESEQMTFRFPKSDLASFDTDNSAWKVAGGTYWFSAAAALDDVRAEASLSIASFSTPVNPILAPNTELNLIERTESQATKVGGIKRETSSAAYNLSGVKASSTATGVLIKDGKKAVRRN